MRELDEIKERMQKEFMTRFFKMNPVGSFYLFSSNGKNEEDR